MKKKIAIFHPWIKSRGGAEKTVLELLKNFKGSELYTWVYEKDNTFEEFKKYKINVIGNNFFRRFSHSNILRGLFLISSFSSKIPLEKYDLFLISTSGVGEFILFKNYKPGKTYAYVHTPLRDADKDIINWNLKNKHRNIISKTIYLLAVNVYKTLEKISWKRIDHAIFNSELSLERAKKRNLIKNKKFSVVYPPTDINRAEKIKTQRKNYFLYPSRINPPKRQDLLIKAWKIFSKKHPNETLIIAGNLENKKYYQELKRLSEGFKNIEIKTNLNNNDFLKLYEESKAVIFVPFMEDFGIVPFEALSLGKPLIAVDKGGYYDLVKKIPQYYPIKEVYSEDKMIIEINKTLENFMKSRVKPKKITNLVSNTTNFINKISEILE
ncbi:MAG TPA: glycosyltransferase [Candidatus Pacearchaeota archaeon]|nr:glycosyltransferase [Candidatus Pacearchaeota archaeon]HOU79424.1 glycosyltransferase [Candidatus Pacearchaeota archaeon]